MGDSHRAGGRGLIKVTDHQRAEIRDRRLRPVDRREAVARLPIAETDEVETAAVKDAAMVANRELAHPLQDEELDLGQLREVDQRIVALLSRSHGIATRSTMSLPTASVVRPW